MVDKNLMSIDQVAEVSDTDMMYTVKAGTSDARVSVGQLRDTVAKTVNGEVGDITLKAGTNVGIETTGVGEITINNELPAIRTPNPVSPLTGAVDVSVTPTLAAGAYGNVYGVTRQYREFQVDVIGGDFSNPIRTFQADVDAWVVDPELLDNTQFAWRCRDFDTEGNVSGYSDVQTFTTLDIYIETPSITKPTDGSSLIERGDPIESSAYQAVNTTETHSASYWEIYQSGSLIHASGRDEYNLVSYQPPSGVISGGSVYSVRVRYEGSSGTLSEFSQQVNFQAIEAGYEGFLAVSNRTTIPYSTVYGIDVDSFYKLPDLSPRPTGDSRSAAFSPDGTYLVFGHGVTPYISIYKRDANTFTKLANPSALPTGQGNGVAFSSDGVYLAVAHTTTPYVTVYKREGDTFTKLANPTILPPDGGNGIAFSSDGVYLAVAHGTSPFITIYKREGDTFTKLANPSSLPTGIGQGVCFSMDGVHMVVTHNLTPFVTIYKREGDTFTKLPNLTELPSSGAGCAFSHDGIHLAITQTSSPFVVLYKREGDTFTKLPAPDVLPAGVGQRVAFSQNGEHMAVAHFVSPFVTIYKRSGDTFTKLPDPDVLPPNEGIGVAIWPSALYPST